VTWSVFVLDRHNSLPSLSGWILFVYIGEWAGFLTMAEADAGQAKRVASSPLSDAEEKRQCLDPDGSFSDPDATIITDTTTAAPEKSSAVADLREALADPGILDMIASAVANKVVTGLKEEVASLKSRLDEKDNEIASLRDQVDGLEQYSRRNCVRIGPIPESEGENTDDIVRKVAQSAGVHLPEDAIDRSHRVGKKPGAGQTYTRSIIVKLTSYKYKQDLMRGRKTLGKVDATKMFPEHTDWPPLPPRLDRGTRPFIRRIYINEDLTKVRSEIAARARKLKQNKVVDDTWVRDGLIHIRRGESKLVYSTKLEMERAFGPAAS
jgi:hypothetical protein